ncbi:MAG: DUF4190 domain-containing protein [Actinobacteria bacterium]|nr:DUF4190 domain-containing protein [Actinomycetota bacterium]
MGLVTCPDCGNAVSEIAVACPQCGRPALSQPVPVPVPPSPASLGQDPIARMLLPVGRSWWAIAAGYLGLVSVTMLPAPLAVIIGIVAIVDIQKHPERHGMGRAIFGIVMGAVFTVLMLVLLLRG